MPNDRAFMGWGIDPATRIQLRLERAREALRKRAYELAATEAEELLDLEPEEVEGLWLLAEATMELGDFTTAQQAYQSLLRLGQTRPAVLIGLAVASFECADLGTCEEVARRVTESHPDFGAPHYLLGLCVHRRDSLGAAMPHFELAHRMSPLDYQVPAEPSATDLQMVLAQTFDELDPELQAFWRTVPIKLVPFPDPAELLRDVPPISPRVPALADGDPDTSDAPTQLRVFTGNLAHLDHPEAMVDQLLQSLEQLGQDWLHVETHGEPEA